MNRCDIRGDVVLIATGSDDIPAQHPVTAEDTIATDVGVPEIRIEEAEDGGNVVEEDQHGDDASDAGTAVSGMTAGFIHGTFFLTRRPVEYLLACPPDEEFTTNRPRALWKLAINATLRVVQSKRLNWGMLSARRQKRQQYIELFKHRELEPWRVRDIEEAQKWAQLIKEIHPDDLHLWRCIAMYQLRRDVTHRCVFPNLCPFATTLTPRTQRNVL